MYCGSTMFLPVRCRSRTKYLLQVMIGYVVMTTLVESDSDPMCANSKMEYICNPQNPGSFFRCLPNGQKVLFLCPPTLHFNTAHKVCDWPRNADCGKRQPLTRPPPATSKLAPTPSPTHPPTVNKVPPKRPVWNETVKKGSCNPKICRLPTCKCPGTEIPGSLNPNVVPQMVLLTFDDGVNIHNINFYRQLYNSNIKNPNGCPIKSTFFVSGDNTNYRMVKEIYDRGHEIASHSLSHRFPTTYWATAGYEGYKKEICGMKKRLAKLSNIAENDIRGMRVPFLQIGGNDQYKMLKDYGFNYDSSMLTNTGKPPIWPFTLDYPVKTEYCTISPCPTKSFPGLWEVPLLPWYGNNKRPCAMADACAPPKSKAKTLEFFRNNFRRHYMTNRAPFGICLHATWFKKAKYNVEALKEFLTELSQMKDVWILTVSQALDWIQHPTPTSSQVRSWNC